MSVERIAVVGLGNAGHTLHLPALARIDSIEVVGACDLSDAMRQRAASSWRIPVFDDFERMLDESRPDVVVVGTPPDSHFSYGLQVLRSGAHLICEKPFVNSLVEADELLRVADEQGRQIALNHPFREMPIFQALREEIHSGRSGRLAFAQVWQLIDMAPWAETGWRGQMLQRTLYEAGVHLVDYLMTIFGEKPKAVQAWTSTCGVHEGGTDAVVLATLEFSEGRLASIVQNRLCKGERQYFEIRADTSSSSLRASFGGRARAVAGLFRSNRPSLRVEYGVSGIAWQERGGKRTFLARNPKDPGMIGTRHIFEKSLQAFRDGSPPPVDAHNARDGLEVIAACYRAAETGRRLEMDSVEVRDLATLRLGGEP